ncbi:MAG TPA: cation transporter, partial [Acinetobacter nosocomialis]|nr:cation transporter [Acinetobacter nosocomialis]
MTHLFSLVEFNILVGSILGLNFMQDHSVSRHHQHQFD